MKVALIGFAASGKSTLYRAAAKGQAKGDVASVPVPDERFDTIVAQVRPKKVTPAMVVLHDDLESIQGGSPKLMSQRFLDAARQADLLLHVVRAFESPMAPYYGEVDPLRDQRLVDEEIVLADQQVLENRLARLTKSQNVKTPGHPDYLEKLLFERILPQVEDGRPIRTLEMSEDEQTIVRNYQLLTAKPMVVAFNVGEKEAGRAGDSVRERMEALAAAETPAFAVCATLEEEVSHLDPADQPEFLADLGIEETAGAKLMKAVYDALGLITFFTAGENETRAWPLRRGSNALKAAGTIHTDIAKGFIRAEVVHYEDYLAAGSLDAAYSAGKMHLEGKEYVVRDGDLLHIRNKT